MHGEVQAVPACRGETGRSGARNVGSARANPSGDMGAGDEEPDRWDRNLLAEAERVESNNTNANSKEPKRIRHLADSCDDCIAMEQLGWQPIGTLIPIGDRQCRGNCGCTLRFR